MDLITMTEAHRLLDGVSKDRIKKNMNIARQQIGRSIFFSREDVEKFKSELEERKLLRINHKKIINNFIKVDRDIYATAHDLWKLTQINPTTIHVVLKRSKLKFEKWNNAKFYNKAEALNLLDHYKGE